LPTPAPPESVTVAIGAVWRISPGGFLGLLPVGGLTMLVAGFAPIYAAAEGYAKEDIALLLFLMQFGMIGVQYPLGALSDRMDRRYVLIAAAAIVVASAALATQMSGIALMWLILVFAVWSGATESIYAIANAHANDRAEPQYYVSLSMTILVAWSISGLVIPGVATMLTQLVGIKAFMYVAIAIAVFYGSFVAYRVLRATAVPSKDQGDYEPRVSQAPYYPELAAPSSDHDVLQQVPDYDTIKRPDN